jgi:hypothetical protein
MLSFFCAFSFFFFFDSFVINWKGVPPPIAEIAEIMNLPPRQQDEEDNADSFFDRDLSNGYMFSASGVADVVTHDSPHTLDNDNGGGGGGGGGGRSRSTTSGITGIENIVNRVSDLGLQGD